MNVFVVSFRPFQERAATGGFEWRVSREAAEQFFDQEAARDDADNYVFRLVEIEVDAVYPDTITAELDSRIRELEYDLPALRERVPS